MCLVRAGLALVGVEHSFVAGVVVGMGSMAVVGVVVGSWHTLAGVVEELVASMDLRAVQMVCLYRSSLHQLRHQH